MTGDHHRIGVLVAWSCVLSAWPAVAGDLVGRVVDATTGKPIECRLYLRSEDGKWYFARSSSKDGSAVQYKKQRAKSVEMHTTLSAHPFVATLPAGRYAVTVERGKEYLSLTRTVEVADQSVEQTFRLRRFVDMAARGWYSGDTHVHRTMEELPNVVLAEDLNVALPLLDWVTVAFEPPSQNKRSTASQHRAEVVHVDPTHSIYPINTEFEIGSVDGKRHMLGAVFVLNHQRVFTEGVPPVGGIARDAHAQGALLELDKHNWPWSMMLVPVMDVDLYELTNNHIWRTEFYFTQFGEPGAAYMNIQRDEKGFTEQGWIDFGFQNYYALLNCGFRLRPTAGTASGVHPVPLGFGRVYVHLDGEFSYRAWMEGLDRGRSFVTTGPLLMVRVNDRESGHTFEQASNPFKCRIQGSALSAQPIERIEVISAGQVVKQVKPANRMREQGGFESPIDAVLSIDRSTWLAVRCYENRASGRVRFAHTAPVHIDMKDRPLRPQKKEVDYLIHRVQSQIERSTGVLPAEAMEEYRQALRVYREIAKKAH